MQKVVNIIGAGLAGSEAAYYLAKRQIHVNLYEMRPLVKTPAHQSGNFGELVCSNSLKAKALDNACGLLKEEMRLLGSIMMEAAALSEVPAGGALAVDRDIFSAYITNKLSNNPYINIINEEVTSLPKGITIIASGPLTSDQLTSTLEEMLGSPMLGFFDASSPIVTKESLDLDKLYYKSRYDKGDASYLNAAMNKEEYDAFFDALINAKRAPIKEIDQCYFESCLPLEEMAKRGSDTLRYGPLKPKGLAKDENDRPYAVVQLRQDDVSASLYNLVGFQTNLTYGEQRRVFGLIPGLENAEYVRYGLMHRNTFVKAPVVLNKTLELKNYPGIFLAGQLSGVEGYVESAASGILAAINAERKLNDLPLTVAPIHTMLGTLIHYIIEADPKTFAPMNANFGIMYGANKKNRPETITRSLDAIMKWQEALHG